MGTNNSISTKDESDKMIEDIYNATLQVRNKKYLVLGLHYDKSMNNDMTLLHYHNNKLMKIFGSKFVDVLSYMNQVGMDDAKLTPDDTDISRIAEGKYPFALTRDHLHWSSDVGYKLLANIIYDSIIGNGYIDIISKTEDLYTGNV